MALAVYRFMIAAALLAGCVACDKAESEKATPAADATADKGDHPLAPTVAWLTSIGAKNRGRPYTVGDLEQIISLRLTVNKRVDDEALAAHVSKLTTLQSLSLDATAVTDAGLVSLSPLVKLRQLDLGSLKRVTGAGIKHLSVLPELESLTLQQTGLQDDDLKIIAAELPELKKLSLGWLPVDGGLKHLAALDELEDLNLYHAKVTNRGAVHLAKLSQLKKLLLWNTQITDKALAALKKLDRLEILYLSGTKVTDKGMKHLAGLDKLAYLWIAELPITDKGLQKLKKCKALRTIHAPKTKITNEGIKKLKEALPELKVTVH